MKITNKTRAKNIEELLVKHLDYLIDRYGYIPNSLTIERNNDDRGMCDSKNNIYIYPDKYETKQSLKWLLTHEYVHLIVNSNRPLHIYLYNTSPDIMIYSDKAYIMEDFLANAIATLEVGGYYGKIWYEKRKNKV
uniref:Uncharacterized protein n=1 Tax=viral metagenome TaxID=1070528 RepID=A0A6M3IK92_9ZZZZ